MLSGGVDWLWKLREAAERLKNSYAHIGRSTGAPFLAIVYPPEAQPALLKEWQALQGMLQKAGEIEFIAIDCLQVTTAVLEEMGIENVLQALQDPMPGSDPQAELGHVWIEAVIEALRSATAAAQPAASTGPRRVVTLHGLEALYPAASPRALMQALWDRSDLPFDGPIVLFIPGKLLEPRVYAFLGQAQEFMYRGDIL